MTEAQAGSPPTKPFDSIYLWGWDECGQSLIHMIKSQFNTKLLKWFMFRDMALHMWKEPSALAQGSGVLESTESSHEAEG